jgi:hypothetical protein
VSRSDEVVSEISEHERTAIARLKDALAAGLEAEARVAERELIEAARATGAAEVWEAWAFLSSETATAVSEAVKQEREAITQRLEALYADPHATWEDILSVARGRLDELETSSAA